MYSQFFTTAIYTIFLLLLHLILRICNISISLYGKKYRNFWEKWPKVWILFKLSFVLCLGFYTSIVGRKIVCYLHRSRICFCSNFWLFSLNSTIKLWYLISIVSEKILQNLITILWTSKINFKLYQFVKI